MSDLISFVTPPVATGANSMQSAASLSSNFDTFLTILTAQIQNQDPLEPMDSTQFTTQLVQFNGVEQQIKQNKNLESIMGSQEALQVASASNYIGKVVDAGGKSILLNGGGSFAGRLNCRPCSSDTTPLATHCFH